MSESIIQLIYNSIDAKSKHIQIQIDLKNYDYNISDNGIGINESDLNSIGKRYVLFTKLSEIRSQGNHVGM